MFSTLSNIAVDGSFGLRRHQGTMSICLDGNVENDSAILAATDRVGIGLSWGSQKHRGARRTLERRRRIRVNDEMANQ